MVGHEQFPKPADDQLDPKLFNKENKRLKQCNPSETLRLDKCLSVQHDAKSSIEKRDSTPFSCFQVSSSQERSIKAVDED